MRINLGKLLSIIFYSSLVLWILTAFCKGHLPSQDDILPSLFSQPTATATTKLPFDVTQKGITYNVKPLYEYEIYGLIVSEHNSASLDDLYHEQWKDYLNIKDICLAFGDNLKTDIYKRVKFSSGSWTCYYRWENSEDGATFKPDGMSNNHILTVAPQMAKDVLWAQKGDQVHMKGYLVKYGKGDEPKRGYNVFRLGVGECQVLYLTDFEILKAHQSFWRYLQVISGWLVFTCIGFWLLNFFLPFVRKH